MILTRRSCPRCGVLPVGTEQKDERVELYSPGRLFALEELAPASVFELRLSYPASQPTRFALRLLAWEPARPPQARSHSGRVLTDTEKLRVVTDEEGVVAAVERDAAVLAKFGVASDDARVFVHVSAAPNGVSHAAKPRVARFNMVLDPTVLGVPATSSRMVLAAALGLALLVFVAVPCFSSRWSPLAHTWGVALEGPGEQSSASGGRESKQD